MEFLKYFLRYSYYIYTVLRLVLKQKHGLEFEREYSALIEGYRYVQYFSYKGITIFNLPVYCTIRGLELERDGILPTLQNTVLHYNVTYTINRTYDTAFNNTAESNIANTAYRTRTVCNTEINDY